MRALISFGFILTLASSSIIQPLSLDPFTVALEAIKAEAQLYADNLPENTEEEANLLVPGIIEKHGYPVEVHTVTTSKGYILEMHRIPYGKSGPSANRSAVYLQHGLLSSSADWIISGPGKSFAYLLADNGYDVWIPNCRGNRYSRKHVSLDPDKDAKFWEFSFHELAVEMTDFAFIRALLWRDGMERSWSITASNSLAITDLRI